MYRYTAQKNQQANKRYAAKKKRQRQSSARVAARQEPALQTASTRVVKRTRKTVTKASLPTRVSKKKATRQLRPAWWLDFLVLGSAYLLVGIVVIVTLMALFWAVADQILPQYFRLERPKTILLVGSSVNERAQIMYLLRFDPDNQAIQAWSLDTSTQVELIGQYNQYPLASIGPLIYRYGNDNLQEVKSAYNFALGTVLDEFYFMPQLQSLTTKADLQAALWQLFRESWLRTGQADRVLFTNYLSVRSAKSVAVTPATDLEAVSEQLASLSRQQLLGCQLRIYNAAATNGLAKRVRGLLRSSGVVVLKLENAPEKIDQTTIYYDEREEDCQRLVAILQENFPKGVAAVADQGQKAHSYRVGAVLYLGEELAR
ncbi:LytR C-terminal domain-containing protein [bacterium]|nr:LytR C-terminal domain-containing protein [bacterium]